MESLALPNRSVLALTGPDTIALLERTVTHTVTDWSPGDLRYGGLLTPQGKIIADYLATRTEDGVLLDVHEDALADLAKRLKMFRLRANVVIETVETLHVAQSEEGASDPRSPLLPKRIFVTSAPEKAAMMYDVQRINAGVPEWGRDYRAAEVFPTDVNMDVMNGIDYRKGCFIGQEVASRMKRKGTIRKRTLVINGAELSTGADISARNIIGTISSVSGSKALARLRLDRLAKTETEGQPLKCGDSTVSVVLESTPWINDEMEAHRASLR